MIIGLGIDLVKIERIKETIDRWGTKFLQRVFTVKELDYCQSKSCSYLHLAARFAAKEAAFKMLRTTGDGIGWQDFEVLNSTEGIPRLVLKGKAVQLAEQKGISVIHLSITHEKEYAMAEVIGEGG